MTMSESFLPEEPRPRDTEAEDVQLDADDELGLEESRTAEGADASEPGGTRPSVFRTPTPGDALTDGELEDDLHDES